MIDDRIQVLLAKNVEQLLIVAEERFQSYLVQGNGDMAQVLAV